jgi:NAD-dependent deacetylase
LKKKKLVILSGAGISAESGLATFRGSDGLWEGHKIEDVATPQAWKKNPEMVLEFYNQRRKQGLLAKPNKGHLIIKALEKDFDVVVITQNVDNLHEQAKSKKIIHLHGHLFQSRSTKNENEVFEITGWELKPGDKAPDGSQLRPNIVWFGEAVPMMETAIDEVSNADFLVVVGTSMQVYPAASLVDYVPGKTPIFVVDPGAVEVRTNKQIVYIQKVATIGMEEISSLLKEKLNQLQGS